MRDQIQHIVPAAALALGCLTLFGMREQKHIEPRAHPATIQLEAPGYVTKDIVIDTNERRVAGMDHYLFRAFNRDTLDAGFSVYVGYYTYQVQGKTIHSPKNCLPGAGWEPLESGPHTVSVPGTTSVDVNRYLLANKGMQALVYYWYQGRGRVEYDEYKVKWYLLRDAALHGRTEEALVRIVVPIDVRRFRSEADKKAVYAEADTRAEEMVRQLVPKVTQVLPATPGA